LLKRSSLTKIALRYLDAGVAQLVEQLTCNQPVGGSTPLASSIFSRESLLVVDIRRLDKENKRPFFWGDS
jgi:hypothetical protein